MKLMTFPISSRCFLLSSGARPVLPMVVAPEAIVESFFEYRLKYTVISSSSPLFLRKFVGCATSAPDGSSPEAVRGCLQPVIDSNISFGQLFLFYTLSTPSSSITFDGILKARDFVGPLVCKGPLRVIYK
jgi:hypothetical protein